ncbi:SPOR domain-containing protein [Cognatilysobacter bugurensis]|uniref:Sporulation protein n=1 Tax=Cognatilysobacter bugurensis TaxID=543356 RepID=A0A918WAC2_9GAMM|nr:SPOR domain-containing protein [Lysobacter bugurensis]GHA88428.1 sporulation protein [Lysobacter bugurensis]
MTKRGKTQARRNDGNGGLPGWAWGVFGLIVGIVLILAAPKVLKDDGDGFLRPRANPDAQPAPVETADDELGAPEATERAATEPKRDAAPARKQTDFDFYTLLPGREVPLSDAELAETARAEAARDAKATAAADAAAAAPARDAALPAPVEDTARPATAPPATAPTTPPARTAEPAATETSAAEPAPADDTTRYLLQAGAFAASGQAEELKAKIAMLGVGARVESAQIGGKTVFRVRMGPYGSASELAEAKRKLATGGLPAMAIKVE